MKIAIIGISYAGIACALRVRAELPETEIIMYDKGATNVHNDENLLRYLATDNQEYLKEGHSSSDEELLDLNITLKRNVSVRNVEPTTKTITYLDYQTNERIEEKYDKLVVATGHYPVLPQIKTDYPERVFSLNSVLEAERLGALLPKAKNISIIGGGLLAFRLAMMLSIKGFNINVFDESDYILDDIFSLEHGRLLKGVFEVLNINLRPEKVTNFYKGNRSFFIDTDKENKVPCDLIILAGEYRPNSFLMMKTLKTGYLGAIVVDKYLHTSDPDILAAGDCAVIVLDDNSNIRGATIGSAKRQGELAALNILEKKRAFPTTQKMISMMESPLFLGTVGLTQKEAIQKGIECETIFVLNHLKYLDNKENEPTGVWEHWFDGANSEYNDSTLIEHNHQKILEYLGGYYAGLLYEKSTYKILGMQIIGNVHSIQETLNYFSLAIEYGRTIKDLEYIDGIPDLRFKNTRPLAKIFADAILKRLEKRGERDERHNW